MIYITAFLKKPYKVNIYEVETSQKIFLKKYFTHFMSKIYRIKLFFK